MTDATELGHEAERLLVRRIADLEMAGASEDRTNFLHVVLDLTRRFLAGERGHLGKIITGKVHYSWIDHGPQLNSAVQNFAYAAEDECEGISPGQ